MKEMLYLTMHSKITGMKEGNALFNDILQDYRKVYIQINFNAITYNLRRFVITTVACSLPNSMVSYVAVRPMFDSAFLKILNAIGDIYDVFVLIKFQFMWPIHSCDLI